MALIFDLQVYMYIHVHVQSTCTVPINKKLTFDDCRTIILRCERFRRTVFSHHLQFRSVFLPFRFHSILLANQRDPCKHEVSVNASFGSEDDLQLLQMVAEGSRYESASVAEFSCIINGPLSMVLHTVFAPFRSWLCRFRSRTV